MIAWGLEWLRWVSPGSFGVLRGTLGGSFGSLPWGGGGGLGGRGALETTFGEQAALYNYWFCFVKRAFVKEPGVPWGAGSQTILASKL